MNQQFGNQFGRIHQNSLFNGAEQSQGFGQERQIHQRTMSGNSSNPLSAGFGGSFGGGTSMMGGQGFQQSQGFNQGFQNQVNQNQVNQNQVDRIHQNSLYNGAEQSQGFGQERQIHQNTMSGFGGGFGGGSSTSMMMSSQAGGQGFGQMNQGMNQGFQNQVNQNQLDRIHQNSLYNGAEQSQGFGQEQQIHQNTMSGFGGGFGGGTSMMMGGQGFGQGFQNQMNQNQMSNSQLQRIHQNSLFNGQNQQAPQGQFASFEQRVNQSTMQNGMMANPQVENNSFGGGQGSMMSQGFGGAGQMGQQGQYNTGAFRQVMSADAGITDSEGPSSYPASMYTGQNQYDTVNQSVLNQMGQMNSMNQMNR